MPFNFILFICFCIICQFLRMRAAAEIKIQCLCWRTRAQLLSSPGRFVHGCYSILQSACHLLLSHELARGHGSQKDSCHTKGQSGCLFSYAHKYKSTGIVLTIENINYFMFCFPVLFLLFLQYLFLVLTAPSRFQCFTNCIHLGVKGL